MLSALLKKNTTKTLYQTNRSFAS